MKLLPILLLNLATVVVALVVYDQVRLDEEPSSTIVETGRTGDEGLVERLDALEAQRRPLLRGAPVDLRLEERLAALEDLMDTQAGRTTTAKPAGAPSGEPGDAELAGPAAVPDPVTEDEVRRWREIQTAARRQERVERNRRRFDRALDKLEFRVSDSQRTKLYAAHAAFEPRIQEIWGEIKQQAQATQASGGTPNRKELMQLGIGRIQEEFASTITDIVHAADADAIAGAIVTARR